jgi:hypothetical protein
MALFSYQQQTQRLIRDIAQKEANPLDLTIYINQARGQLAGDSQAIKRIGTFSLVVGQRGQYAFSGITLSPSTGVSGVLNVRQLWYLVGDGQIWFRPRSWPWFSLYHLNNPVPGFGAPEVWSQYGDGESGTLYFDPLPDDTYTINADCACVPVDLTDDTTAEAIPAPWTIAVPYYAAYLALLATQTGAKMQEAEKMFALYQTFVGRARQFSTPEILPLNAPQQANPTRDNQLGIGGGGSP